MKKTPFTRREVLRTLGMGMIGFSIPVGTSAKSGQPIVFEPLWDEVPFNPDKPVTAITLGAGARGNAYGNFALKFPDLLKIIGVAEPIDIRRERYKEKHQIQEKNCYETWEEVFCKPKFADAVIISTPDDLHFGPCMAALEMGYDILLEKPIAPTERECKEILKKSQEMGSIVAVCHVLRYVPYFQKLRTLIQSGGIGKLISMHHFEPIEHIHMAHSFVRGNWHNSKATTPIILAKSCHDMDMIRWLVDKPCRKMTAFGDLSWFHSRNAPSGSTNRCMDGCTVESQCPYSALKIYHRNRHYTYVFDLPDDQEKHGDAILKYLKETDYGRCVFKMENDQPDHYVCAMEFEGGVTCSFNMEAFTSYHGRRTRVMGSMGDIVGDNHTFKYTNFITGEVTLYDNTPEDLDLFKDSGHGGGDWRLVYDWIRSISTRNPDLLSSTIEASIDSHLMAFAAEKSRSNKTVEML